MTLRVIGQEYYVQQISKEKGFGLSGTSSMIEDHQGVIWVGTQLGLLRFDGQNTTSFLPEKDNPNSLSNEYINDLLEDHYGRIWVATRNGLNCIEANRKRIQHYFHDTDDPFSIPGDGIFELVSNSDSTFYIICARNGFAEFNINTGKSTRLDPILTTDPNQKLYENRFIVDIYPFENHTTIARTNSGTFLYNREANQLESVIDSVTHYDEYSFLPTAIMSREGELWFADAEGSLFKWIPFRHLNAFRDTLISSAVQQWDFVLSDFDENNILISTSTSLTLVHKKTGAATPFRIRGDQKNLIGNMSIKQTLKTSKGIVFMSTLQGNLLVLDPLRQQFKFKPVADPLLLGQFSETCDFYDDVARHRRYISIVQDSFFYIENTLNGQITSIPKERISNIATRWMMDQSNRLWLCDSRRMLEINQEDFSVTEYTSPVGTLNIFDMAEGHPGEMIAVSFLSGLFRFVPDQHIFERIPETKGWKDCQLSSIQADLKHNCIWIGTIDHGVYRYDIEQDTFIQYLHYTRNSRSLGGNWVRDITLDSLGYVWFAVEPIGLSRFDYNASPDVAFQSLTMADGLPSSYISGLATDQQGNIWMTTLNGIAKLDPSDNSVRQFNKTDGLPSTRFTRSAIYVTPKNEVLIGNRNGYFYFNAKKLRINTSPPDLVFRDLLVLNKSNYPANTGQGFEALSLHYYENYITFLFSVVNYTDPERNAVKYILEGLDDEWITRSGISEVSYTKVPPGTYRFRIKASTEDGVWNSKEIVIPIIIRPAFWQTTWFYMLIGSMVLGIIFAFYNFKLRQSIKQNKLIAEREFVKSESERQLSQLEMTALRAQMNPHFVFNCLNSINRFIVVNDNEAASEYLTKFSKLIRQVLDNSRGEKVLLSTEIDTLKLYIDMESLRFNDKFEYTINVDADLEPSSLVIQPMLVQPYVENAIWHGLMHRRTKGSLQIHFIRKENALLVTIQDNGVGREMAKQIKEKQLITRKSHGMKVTAQRMALLSKKLNVPVEAVVEDMYDGAVATGTRVILTLPLETLIPESEPIPKT